MASLFSGIRSFSNSLEVLAHSHILKKTSPTQLSDTAVKVVAAVLLLFIRPFSLIAAPIGVAFYAGKAFLAASLNRPMDEIDSYLDTAKIDLQHSLRTAAAFSIAYLAFIFFSLMLLAPTGWAVLSGLTATLLVFSGLAVLIQPRTEAIRLEQKANNSTLWA